MAVSTHNGDMFINGTLTAQNFAAPANSVSDTAIQAAANLAASKLEHQHQVTYTQASAANASTDRQVVHVVKGATGSIVDFRAGAVTAAGASSSATVDLKKNGVTVLSSTITLDNTTASFALKQPAGYSSTALVAGDVLEVHVTAVSGVNLPVGLFANLVLREKAQ